MSKFDDAMGLYTDSLKNAAKRSTFDVELLTKVAKGLGPSIYLGDASLVSCSEGTEKTRVKEKFLMGKLGLADSPALDAAITEVCETLGTSNRSKHRAVFYYLLVEKFGKSDVYNK